MMNTSNQKEIDNSCCNRLMKEILEVRKDIKDSVVPKFIKLSIETKDLVEHAIEIWRLENRIKRILTDSTDEQKEMIINSISKLKRYLERNDIEAIDHTNQKYNGGLNLDILAVEKDSKIKESIIKETKEPTITHKGQVISKGKVIVLMKEEASDAKNE